jgi:hypothetical protein
MVRSLSWQNGLVNYLCSFVLPLLSRKILPSQTADFWYGTNFPAFDVLAPLGRAASGAALLWLLVSDLH